ncbi:MAG: trigger factor [Oscillospiraceae bacterium]|jgi:trigger factor|nr:trigger factor [Oscillospiraceae bacterium]
MISTVERLSPAQVKLRIEVDADAFEAAVHKAYLKQRGQINMPGFRRGKAPRKLIESIYGPRVFFDDAINQLFPEAYGKSLMEHTLSPLDEPQQPEVKAEIGEPLEITVSVAVYPTVEIGDLAGISVERMGDEVDDDAVDQEIERVRERNARVSEVEDRPARDDDLATIDYKGTVDGEPFEGSEAENEQLTIGSGSFVAGFEDQIIGMNPGEERDIDITFPEDYFQEDLRGKKAVFHITLRAIRARELPDLDDEFAKDVSEFDTLDEYRAHTRSEMEKAAKRRADYQYDEELLSALAERAVTEAPETMVEYEANRSLERQARSMVGDKPDRIESFMNMFSKNEDVMGRHRAEATKRVITRLAVDELIKREGLYYNPDKDQDIYREMVKAVAAEEGLTEEALEERVAKSRQETDSLRSLVERRKALRYLAGVAEGSIIPGAKDQDAPEPESADQDAPEPEPIEPETPKPDAKGTGPEE